VSLGYTHEQVDEMTIPMVEELNRYWSLHPPMHIMVADYLGYKPKAKEKQADLAEIIAMSNAMNGVM